jgi:hypothetical protein
VAKPPRFDVELEAEFEAALRGVRDGCGTGGCGAGGIVGCGAGKVEASYL